jgi:hypothetical protein
MKEALQHLLDIAEHHSFHFRDFDGFSPLELTEMTVFLVRICLDSDFWHWHQIDSRGAHMVHLNAFAFL